jgi:hypothetical protein
MARGQGAGAAREKAPRDGAVWRPSVLQRAYRKLLDRAKEEPQVIEDSDGSLLVVESKERSDFGRELAEELADVAQFQAAYSANAGKRTASWAAQTPYAWLAALDSDEVADFARELLSFGLDAARRGTLEHFRGNLRAWESTAGAYGSPDVLEALLEPIEIKAVTEVFPPSEHEAREAAGEPA